MRIPALFPSALSILVLAALVPACKKSTPAGPLTLSSISPTSIYGGDTLLITGSNLPADSSHVSFTLNGMSFKIIAYSRNSISAIVPKMVGSGYATLTFDTISFTSPLLTYNYVAVVTTVAGNGQSGQYSGPALSSTFSSDHRD